MLKSVLLRPYSKVKLVIALELVVVVALIIGLSVCLLTRQTSPLIFVLEPCNVDGITCQCTTEGRIIDFPVFIQTLKTDMNDEKDMCTSANLALIRQAARMTGTESTRDLENLYMLDIIYLATDGPGWFKMYLWMSDQPYCFCQGVLCNRNSDVLELHLEQNNLAGMLPTEIGLFLPVRPLALLSCWQRH
jgi:hypothetical protein